VTRREKAVAVVERLRAAGHEAYFAGGSVRDALLGKTPQDYDIATAARPDDIRKIFPRTVEVGAQFGVVLVIVDGDSFEVATFRYDGPYLDGRRPSAVRFAGMHEDILRRDFTVNGMMYDPIEDRVIDLAGGRDDLERRLIRAIGDPRARFCEDRLRMIRAARFAASLGFTIEPETFRAIQAEAPTITQVSWERIGEEITRILTEGGARRGFEILDATGLLAAILPEIARMKGVEQTPDHHPEGDVFAHTMLILERLDASGERRAASGKEQSKRVSETLAYGALLHDVGKPRSAAPKEGAPGEHTFYDHEKLGARMTTEILQRLRFPRRETERVALLVAEHNWHYLPEWNDATVRRVLARVGPSELPALWALRRADLTARGRFVEEGLATQDAAEARFQREIDRAAALKVTDLAIGGEDVMRELRVGPGREVGQVLSRLLERVIDDPELNTRETLLRLLPEASKTYPQ